ncbi:MAG: glutathione peroxidase, partial [Parashewanella sp.]
MTDIYQFSALGINGESTPLSQYQGKVLLIVNTASGCGFTPQYKGLEQIYKQYQAQGFMVLGFPCNQFANQEKADEQEIA